jgi:hypothetical protein
MALTTDEFLIVTSSRQLFPQLKIDLEKLFKLTLQEGFVLQFLNIRIVQSPTGISIDQTDHIIESIVEPYFKLRDTTNLMHITSCHADCRVYVEGRTTGQVGSAIRP